MIQYLIDSIYFKKLLRMFFFFILVIFSHASLSQKTITLNTTLGPPFSTPSQTGFIDQVVTEAFNRIGYKLDTIHLPPERALIMANSGISDGELARIGGMQKMYPNLIQVPYKVFNIDVVLFSKNKPDFVVNGWDSVESHSLVIITGWKILENNFGKLGDKVDLIKTDSPGQSFALLSKDRADFFAYFKLPGLVYLAENGISDITLLSPPLTEIGSYVYLHKKHEKIVPKLNGALHEMENDGTIEKLFNIILKPYL